MPHALAEKLNEVVRRGAGSWVAQLHAAANPRECERGRLLFLIELVGGSFRTWRHRTILLLQAESARICRYSISPDRLTAREKTHRRDRSNRAGFESGAGTDGRPRPDEWWDRGLPEDEKTPARESLKQRIPGEKSDACKHNRSCQEQNHAFRPTAG